MNKNKSGEEEKKMNKYIEWRKRRGEENVNGFEKDESEKQMNYKRKNKSFYTSLELFEPF